MSGRLLGLACTVSTAALAAQALLAPGLAVAAAEPPEPGGRAVTAPRTPDPDGPQVAGTESSDTDDRSVARLLTDLQRLYQEAERASEAFNATEEQLKRRRAETGRLDAELVKARLSLHRSRGAAAGSPASSTRAAPASPRTCGCCSPAIRSTLSTRGI